MMYLPAGAKLAKAPGDSLGAIIWFDYIGPAARLWVGFGLTWNGKTDGIYQYVGGYIDAPESPEPNGNRLHIRVEDNLVSDPPHTEQDHECWVFVGTGPDHGTEIEHRQYDDVYKIGIERAEVENLTASFF